MTPTAYRTTRSTARSRTFAWIQFSLASILLVGLVVTLSLRLGAIPALGPLLDPVGGFWRQAEAESPWHGTQTLRIPGLRQPVQVVVDDRLVPHIFAQNDHDLYLAQGYLTAQLRLWQMDIATRAAGGMLSEIMGPSLLNYDKDRRRVGMLAGAERALAIAQRDSLVWPAFQAYVAGVNAYIAQLSPRDYPLEYKLVGASPAPWTELRCFLMLKSMAWTLSSNDTDWEMSHVLARLGPELVNRYYPDYPEIMDPIIPPDTKWDFQPLPVPPVPDNYLRVGADTSRSLMAERYTALRTERNPSIGSNNWVVAGSRTASGYPILANDPHLNLTLPSIWLEIQLVGPEHNVYGVSLPGVPTVIIGFNEQVAWGLTNVGSDVRDWYRIQFRDATLQEYRHGDTWKPITRRVEEIRQADGSLVRDTVLWTHHGPIVFPDTLQGKNQPIGFASRWVALDSSNEGRTVLLLNRARNYEQYVAALEHFHAPAQNFVFASHTGDIGLWVNGKFPLKWQGQGKFVLDGSDPRHDWQGFIPHAHNPHSKNPPRGFLSSANQQSAAPSYPYYLDWDQEVFERGMRINQVLATYQKATPDSLLALQNDNRNLNAELVLPALNRRLARLALKGTAAEARNLLAEWTAENDAQLIAPTIFSQLLNTLEVQILKDDLATSNRLYPNRDQIAEFVLADSLSPLIDNRNTPQVERLDDLLAASLDTTLSQLTKRLGPLGEAWQWGRAKGSAIRYLLPGATFARFSRELPTVGGGPGIVNATGRTSGPSWKMIVTVTPTGPEGRGVYPGGQSGNPGSKFYDNFVDTWAAGQNYPLLYLRQPQTDQPLGQLTLEP